MALVVTDSGSEPRSHSIGPIKRQIVKLTANSGDTSGTVTADCLSSMVSLVAPSAMKFTAAKTYSGNVATLVFTVPAETKASKVIQDITYTAAANLGAGGNSITITYSDTVEAGAEVASFVGKAITVTMDSGESTATQIKAALDAASPSLASLVTYSITGTASNPQNAVSATALTGGITGGIACDAIAMGV